jgi:hypothetical protein
MPGSSVTTPRCCFWICAVPHKVVSAPGFIGGHCEDGPSSQRWSRLRIGRRDRERMRLRSAGAARRAKVRCGRSSSPGRQRGWHAEAVLGRGELNGSRGSILLLHDTPAPVGG